MSTARKAAAAPGTRRQSGERKTYHHGDLKRALIDAARALLEKEGAAGTSLRAAARKAGVSQTAPYHHFADKNALLAAVAAEGYNEFDALMRQMMAKAGDDSHAKLFESGVAYVKFATKHPALFKLMFGSAIEKTGTFPELVEAGDRAFRTLLDNVTAVLAERKGGGAPSGATAADRQDVGADADVVMTTALSVWSRVHGLATLLVDGGLNPKRYPARSPEALAREVLSAPVLEEPWRSRR